VPLNRYIYLDIFLHLLVKNTTIQKLTVLPSWGESIKCNLLGPLDKSNLNPWAKCLETTEVVMWLECQIDSEHLVHGICPPLSIMYWNKLENVCIARQFWCILQDLTFVVWKYWKNTARNMVTVEKKSSNTHLLFVFIF
jgi:hypothetical protein